MKFFFGLITSIALSIVININAFGQASYNATLDAYVNPATGNAWNSLVGIHYDNMLKSMSQMQQYNMQYQNAAIASALIVQAYKQEYGQKRINAGQASTRFVYSPENSVLEEISAAGTTSAEKQQIKNMASTALQAFNDVMRSKKLTINDMADANALSLVLCYFVYKNEDPGLARLNKLRPSLKRDILLSAIFQGTTNKEKQKFYAWNARRAIITYLFFNK